MYKKYDAAQTPYQRALVAPEICESVKEALREQFESLDPVDLLTRVENLQNALWRYANQPQLIERTGLPEIGQPRMTRKPVKTPVAQISSVAHDERPRRRYRRQKTEPIVRYWRTRKDPFVDVWLEVEERLDANPLLTGKFLFYWLNEKYPGKFKEGQLRTFQRRIREWRSRSIEKLIADDQYEE